jgi:hypothetical protein
MKIKFIFLVIITFSIFFIIGCVGGNSAGTSVDTENYGKVRAVVWNYIENQGWYHHSKEAWESATVVVAIADKGYKTLDKNYYGKEIYVVTSKDALAAPTIYVSTENFEVIGYSPGE